MRPEYADYLLVNFERRLMALRDMIFDEQIGRADDYIAALENYMKNHEVAQVNWLGIIQWQGSEAQEYVLRDIEEDIHLSIGYRYLSIGYRSMYDLRPEYFNYFDYQTFKQKVRQEVKTKKYHTTMAIRNMQGVKAT